MQFSHFALLLQHRMRKLHGNFLALLVAYVVFIVIVVFIVAGKRAATEFLKLHAPAIIPNLADSISSHIGCTCTQAALIITSQNPQVAGNSRQVYSCLSRKYHPVFLAHCELIVSQGLQQHSDHFNHSWDIEECTKEKQNVSIDCVTLHVSHLILQDVSGEIDIEDGDDLAEQHTLRTSQCQDKANRIIAEAIAKAQAEGKEVPKVVDGVIDESLVKKKKPKKEKKPRAPRPKKEKVVKPKPEKKPKAPKPKPPSKRKK